MHLPQNETYRLLLQVIRWSDATYLEDQDMWRLSGLHRDVTLTTKPGAHIADFHVSTPLTFLPPVSQAAGGAPQLAAAQLVVDVHVSAQEAAALEQCCLLAHFCDDSGMPELEPMPIAIKKARRKLLGNHLCV